MNSTTPLRETDIRPDHLRAGAAERYAADVRRLLARRSEFVDVPCPACGSREARPAFRKFELHYLTCLRCETMYVSPRPSPAVLRAYYATSENYAYWNQYIFPASEAARRASIFRPRAERVAAICRRYGLQTDSLLEVGAGFGTFCEEVRSLNLFRRLVAVEPTPDLAARCRSRGLEVIEKPIEAVDLPQGAFDAVVSFEVLEHLFSPGEYVRRCGELLRPGGLLVVTCPNVKGFDVVVLGARSDTVDTEHLNYFHPASLSRLVGASGFEVLEVETPGKLDAELVRKKVLAGNLDLAGNPFLRQVLVEEWDRLGGRFQEFLAANRLSSHMWLVGRKL